MARVIVRPIAEYEIQDAYDWSEAIEPGLGPRFSANVDQIIETLEGQPLAFPVFYRTIRRVVIRQSPYLLYYLPTTETVYVVACFSAHRDPRWIRRRLAARGGV